MITERTRRVADHTTDDVNREIRQSIERSVARAISGGPYTIDDRLAELEGEWDIERVLQANFAGVVLIGTALGTTVDRRFYTIPAIAALFMLQHVLQGWCPPLPLFRRAGFRTCEEIQIERAALKAVRGDFLSLPARPDEAPELVEAAAS